MGLEELFSEKKFKKDILRSSNGTLNHLGMFGHLYGLQLSENALKNLGERIRNKIAHDLRDCHFTINKLLSLTFNITLEDYRDLDFYNPISTYEFLEFLSSTNFSNKVKLNEKTLKLREQIRNRTNQDIIKKSDIPSKHQVLMGENFKKHIQKGSNENPIIGIILSQKHPESLARKLLISNGKIISPLEEDIIEYFDDLKGCEKLTPTEFKKRRKIVRDTSISYLKKAFKTKHHFHYHHYNNDFDFGPLNKTYFQKLAQIFFVDGSRAKIIIENQNAMEKINDTIENKFERSQGYSFGILPDRLEFSSQDNNLERILSKDGTTTIGIRGNTESSRGEIKIQTYKEYLEAEIGGSPNPKILPHTDYDYEKIRKVKLYHKSEEIKKARRNISIMYGLTMNEIFKTKK